jgi:hypothetical protein
MRQVINPAEFRRIVVEEVGELCALANMAECFQTTEEPYEAWEREYFIMEAEQLLEVIKKLPTQ